MKHAQTEDHDHRAGARWPVGRLRTIRRDRPRARKGHRRHLDADQVLGALDLRRRQHGEGVQGRSGYEHRPAVRRGRHPEPARPDREHDHQGRQGAGHRRDRRHHAVGRRCRRPPTAGVKVIAYDRLIRDSRQRRLLRHLRQLQGRRAAGADIELALGLKERFRRAPATSSCSAARPTTTTPSSSTTAPCRCCSPDRQRQARRRQSGQMGMDKVGTLRWDGAVAQARMDNLLSANYTRQAGRRRAVAL